jgi:hypothetical protein
LIVSIYQSGRIGLQEGRAAASLRASATFVGFNIAKLIDRFRSEIVPPAIKISDQASNPVASPARALGQELARGFGGSSEAETSRINFRSDQEFDSASEQLVIGDLLVLKKPLLSAANRDNEFALLGGISPRSHRFGGERFN